jgi:hypothetical protein
LKRREAGWAAETWFVSKMVAVLLAAAVAAIWLFTFGANGLTSASNFGVAVGALWCIALLVAAGAGETATVEAMTRVIERQISDGIYISRHVQGEAVDILSNTNPPLQPRVLEEVVAELLGKWPLYPGGGSFSHTVLTAKGGSCSGHCFRCSRCSLWRPRPALNLHPHRHSSTSRNSISIAIQYASIAAIR